MNRNAIVIVFSILLAAVVGMAGLVCLVILPAVIQSRREAAHREQVAKNLRKIGVAAEEYAKRGIKCPAIPPLIDANVPFDTYSGYFISNKFEPDAPESFVVISSQEQFDGVFGVAAVMDDKSHRLPEDAFAAFIVLAIIKRGPTVVDYRVENVAAIAGVVDIYFTTSSKESDTAEFASPLIVSIPKGEYSAVRFVENGKVVKEIGTESGAEG